MELSATGKLALSYAEEIFQRSAELEAPLSGGSDGLAIPFRVGIADVVPKSIARQLLAPVLTLAEPIRPICREDRLERPLADLAIHRLDMVLADRPVPPDLNVKGHSRLLGEYGMAFFATPDIASRLRTDVASNRDGTPMPIPGEDSALRAPLMRWLERQGPRPRVIAELDDSALMEAFGQSGAGVFPAPAAMAPELDDRDAVVPLGQTEDMRERFFAISAERRLTHPAVVAVSETARSGVFRKAVG